MKVVWSNAAVEHIEAIHNYISCDSRRSADRVAECILDRGDTLGIWPESGSIVPELTRSDIREVFEYSYRIIYQIRESHICVLAVIHGARRLPRLAEID